MVAQYNPPANPTHKVMTFIMSATKDMIAKEHSVLVMIPSPGITCVCVWMQRQG